MCGTTDRSQVELPLSAASAGAARAFTAAGSCTRHGSEVLDDAMLLVSELVSNSVKHGSPPLLLAMECDGLSVRVLVRDGTEGVPRPRAAEHEDEGGRGLTLVDLLSDAWGVFAVDDELGSGKTVWFELRPRG